MNEWVGILWLVLLLMANAFFVGAEFAIMSARRSQIEPLAEAGSKRARTTLYAMEHVSLMLACAQLGITVASLLILNVAEPAIKNLVMEPILSLGVPYAIASPAVFLAVLLLVTFLHVTFGEMVPKNIAVSVADKAALILAPPLVWVARVIRPVIVSLNWMANHILRWFRIEPKDEVASSFTLEEVQGIVAASTRDGLVDDETGLLSGALEFSAHTAGQTMVPVESLHTLATDATAEDVESSVRRTGFSRFVLGDDQGNLTGYVHIKDVLNIPEADYQKPLGEARARNLINIGESEELEDALRTMQASGSHLARVVTAENRVVGVLFLEDVIEELVGEIRERERA
ncbi:hemolysin family protein [Acaricomes phytoseiuli]|uniref:hemolysin family protein n=1 Tax=Acaricomes phytoseiuli TaxID=291968 RepID=UPI00037352C1|nr:hemolysin family protein [Acaricomes phytoseiuli]MCW1249374.1 hemolysin family protein [Acaricomes phytoseiuli]